MLSLVPVVVALGTTSSCQREGLAGREVETDVLALWLGLVILSSLNRSLFHKHATASSGLSEPATHSFVPKLAKLSSAIDEVFTLLVVTDVRIIRDSASSALIPILENMHG